MEAALIGLTYLTFCNILTENFSPFGMGSFENAAANEVDPVAILRFSLNCTLLLHFGWNSPKFWAQPSAWLTAILIKLWVGESRSPRAWYTYVCTWPCSLCTFEEEGYTSQLASLVISDVLTLEKCCFFGRLTALVWWSCAALRFWWMQSMSHLSIAS